MDRLNKLVKKINNCGDDEEHEMLMRRYRKLVKSNEDDDGLGFGILLVIIILVLLFVFRVSLIFY